VEVELSASLFGPLANMLDGSHTLGDIAERCRQEAQGPGETPLDAFVSAEKARGVEDVLVGLIRQGLLVADASKPAMLKFA
jgi:hypothetical protein